MSDVIHIRIYILMNYIINMSVSYMYYKRVFCLTFNIFQMHLYFFEFPIFCISQRYLLSLLKRVTYFYIRLEQDISC